MRAVNRSRTSRASRCLLGLVAVVAALSVPDVGSADKAARYRDQARALEAETHALATRSHAAVLEIYALDARLSAARARAAELAARLDAVRRRRALVKSRLGSARETHAAAQAALARRLRLLYERGEVDTLSVILDAESLDDAITGLNAVQQAAAQDRRVADEARAARARFTRAGRALAARQRELTRLAATATAAASELERARAERAATIARLAREAELDRSQIAVLERRASAAEATSRALTATAAPAPVVTPTSSAAPTTPPAVGGRRLTVIATAYSLPGNTASGLPTGPGVVAVDPSVIPLGTRISIPGYGEGIAADTGVAIKGARIDVWFPTLAQARAWGARTVTITIRGG